MDFCEVLVMVPHNILLSNLVRSEFDGWAVWWIRNWQDGCVQRGVGNDSISAWRSLKSGVPQGPILGPVQFYVKHTLSKFVGDSRLGGAVHMPEGEMPSKGMWTSLRSEFT